MADLPEARDPRKVDWRDLARLLLFALVVVSVILGSLFAYARTWPPIVAVESGSMQHSASESAFGVIDTGDLIIVQAIAARAEVVTYIEGRAAGYSTYGEYGDVLVFRDPQDISGTPFIHRALAYVIWNETFGGYDVPDLARLNASDWQAWGETGLPTNQPYALSRFVLHRAGWRQDTDVYVNFTAGERQVVVNLGSTGFLTMGDQNVYLTITKFDRWIVPPSYVLGKARGEIPWFGLLKLTLLRQGAGCCAYWGSTDPDVGAPGNSWIALDVSLVLLIGVPLAWSLVDLYLDRHPERRERLRAAWRGLWRRGMRVEQTTDKEALPEEETREGPKEDGP